MSLAAMLRSEASAASSAAAGKEAAARALQRERDALEGLLDSAAANLTPAVWQGRSATLAADGLEDARAQLTAALHRIDDHVAALRAEAASLEDAAAGLLRAAEEAALDASRP